MTWSCYDCGMTGNPSGFAATTRELETHLATSFKVQGYHDRTVFKSERCQHGYYTYGGAKGDRTKVDVGPHLLYGQEIVESSIWEKVKEGVLLATGGFYLGVADGGPQNGQPGGNGGLYGSSLGKAPATYSQNDLVKQRFNVLDEYKETHDTITILSDFPDTWMPGQFSMLGTAATGEVPISFSGKRDGCTMQTIRKVGRVTSVLFDLQPGATITQRGPFGHGWEYKDAGKLLLIAGGCGMAPLMPVLDEWPDATVLYGARTPDDFYSLPDGADVEWITAPGVVTDLIVATHRFTDALICGPEPMIHAAAKCLLARGFQPDRIQVSLERKMVCAIGLCEQCTCGKGKLVCKDGPVFKYSEIM